MSNIVEDFLSSHPYTAETKRAYQPILEELILEDYTNWTAKDLLKFINRPNWGNSLQHRNLCTCRKFIAWQLGHKHPATSARIKRVIPKKGRSLDLDQVGKLLASFDPYTQIGARDLALAALALDTGLRASELARVQLADVDLQRRVLQVIVKGGQWGVAVFSQDTAMFIDRWLSFRQPATGVASLFVSLRNTRHFGQQLTNYGIKAIFKKWGLSLGFKLSPHDARRTFGNIATLLGSPAPITMAAGRWHSEQAFKRYTQEVTALAITPYLPVSHAIHRQR